jgi:hypothetical protein
MEEARKKFGGRIEGGSLEGEKADEKGVVEEGDGEEDMTSRC